MADTNVAPGLEGVAATHSSISHIDGAAGLLSYRGYAIDDLVAHSSFEEVALLLLDGALPDGADLKAFDEGLRSHRQVKYNVREIMKFMPVTGHPMDMLHCAVASLGMFYPQQELSDAERENTPHLDAMAMRIIARMPTIVAMWEQMRFGNDPIVPRTDLDHAANFLYMISGKEPNPALAKILDTCLILHAEHTINASTFAVLVTGSTLTNPYHVIGSAIGTLAGPLHGGANQKVVEMLEEIGSVAKVGAYLDAKMANKEKIWGFGHRVYKTRDPRAAILKEMMENWPATGICGIASFLKLPLRSKNRRLIASAPRAFTPMSIFILVFFTTKWESRLICLRPYLPWRARQAGWHTGGNSWQTTGYFVPPRFTMVQAHGLM